ncbi:hypothetical protein HDZ31DRAFT_39896, partial [Schizophyllum fasciatum]
RAKRRGNTGKLLRLLEMPLDVLYEVFRLLEPQDLVAVAWTSKLVRSYIMSPQAAAIWREARKRIGAPEPPLDRSEPWWASLLFGSKKCQVCDCRGINNVDWMLLRRVCNNCKREKYDHDFGREFRYADPKALELVLFTHAKKYTAGLRGDEKYYWREDVERMLKEIDHYRADIAQQKPGAEAAFATFEQRRLDFVDDVMQFVSSPLSLLYVQAYIDLHSIEGRLLAQGCDERDVSRALHNPNMHIEKKELTDRAWKKIQGKWEKEVDRQRERTMLEQHLSLIEKRHIPAAELYVKSYRFGASPREWTTIRSLSLPSTTDVLNLEPFQRLIFADANATISEGQYQEALQECSSEIETLRARNERFLRTLAASVKADIDKEGLFVTTKVQGDAVFDLAMATCEMHVPSYAKFEQCLRLQDYLFHRNCVMRLRPLSATERAAYESPEQVVYNRDYSRAVLALLRMFKLSAATTTFEDLDKRNPRVFCMRCPALHIMGKQKGRKAFGWRAAVIHFGTEHPGPESPQWKMLSAHDVTLARAWERHHELERARTWACMHCQQNLLRCESLEEVVMHVKDVHGVDAMLRRDLVCMPAAPVNTEHVVMYV